MINDYIFNSMRSLKNMITVFYPIIEWKMDWQRYMQDLRLGTISNYLKYVILKENSNFAMKINYGWGPRA